MQCHSTTTAIPVGKIGCVAAPQRAEAGFSRWVQYSYAHKLQRGPQQPKIIFNSAFSPCFFLLGNLTRPEEPNSKGYSSGRLYLGSGFPSGAIESRGSELFVLPKPSVAQALARGPPPPSVRRSRKPHHHPPNPLRGKPATAKNDRRLGS